MREIKLPRLRASAEDDPRPDEQERISAPESGRCRHGSARPECKKLEGTEPECSEPARPCPSPAMPQLKAICADEAEILALAVVRYIAAAAMTSDSACWDAAHDHADMHLGHHEGAAFVGAMAGLVRAVRIERTLTWRFVPATCCRLTEDETDLMRLLGAARRRREGDLDDIARRITSMVFPERLMESARRAALAIESAQARFVRMPADGAPSTGVRQRTAETVH